MTFARDHWQVARLKPKFIEISAGMLKFVPFSQHAGNLGRVVKDLRYLLANQDRVNGDVVREEACGIVDQQVARMTKAAELSERRTGPLTILWISYARSNAGPLSRVSRL